MKEQKIHFYSHRTHTSVELPAGWEEAAESDALVIYKCCLDEMPEAEGLSTYSSGKYPDPILAIQIFALASPTADANEKAAAAFLRQRQDRIDVIRKDQQPVDSYDALTLYFTARDADYPGDSYQIQCFITADNVLFSFTAACPTAYRSLFAPVFDDALKSIRFIFYRK